MPYHITRPCPGTSNVSVKVIQGILLPFFLLFRSFQPLITRIIHGNESWRLTVPPHHDAPKEQLISGEAEDHIRNLVKLNERLGNSPLFALLRRQALPVLLGARRRDPTRRQAVHANIFLIAQRGKSCREPHDGHFPAIVTGPGGVLAAVAEGGS